MFSFQLTGSDLGNNNISELPSRVFHSQKHLQQLFLRGNHIKSIPSGLFEKMYSLKWLMLQENEFYTISLAELRFLTSLEWIDLSKNHLNFEGEQFPEQLVNLQEMYVRERSFSSSFSIFKSCRVFIFNSVYDYVHENIGRSWFNCKLRLSNPFKLYDIYYSASLQKILLPLLQGLIIQRDRNNFKHVVPWNAKAWIFVS